MLESVFSELKKLEREIDVFDDQISFCFFCELVPDVDSLKQVLVRNKVIGPEDEIALEVVEDVSADILAICSEWRFDPDVSSRLCSIALGADVYYRMSATGSYALYGYLTSECRVLSVDGSFILLEFDVVD